jgi:hypothetical protein
MLDLEVYGNHVNDGSVKFKLEKHFNSIDLVVVDEDGDRCLQGSIITILPDGELILHPDVAEEFGFNLDKLGRIVVANF